MRRYNTCEAASKFKNHPARLLTIVYSGGGGYISAGPTRTRRTVTLYLKKPPGILLEDKTQISS